MAYKYFLYSNEQFKEKNEVLAKAGKTFTAGEVVTNGKRMKFTQISDKPVIPRFIDTEIVAQGEISQFTYTDPVVSKRKVK